MAAAWIKRELRSFAETLSEFLAPSDRCQYCQGPLMKTPGSKYYCCPNSTCIQLSWDHYIRMNFKSDENKPCRKPGCTRPAYVESDGRVLDYCGRQHAEEHLSFLRDCRGVARGKCNQSGCSCVAYDGGTAGKKCLNTGCGHFPGQHRRKDQDNQQTQPSAISSQGDDELVPPKSSMSDKLEHNGLASGLFPVVENLEDDADDTVVGHCEDEKKPKSPISAEPRCIEADVQDEAVLSPDQTCIVEGCTRKRYSDDVKTHEFCGRTHANFYRRQQQRHKKRAILKPSQRGKCSLPGCEEFKYQDPSNGRIHEFCSRKHAFQANQSSSIPTTAGSISTTTASSSQAIVIKPASSQEVSEVTRKFTRQWASGKGPCPQIDFVFLICNTKLKQIWENYKDMLPTTDTEEHFHGTKLDCDITRTSSLCNSQECGVCGIARIGLDRRCIRKYIAFQRFGHGFYLAPNSSKCHDYTRGKNNYRAMMLFDVCPGKKYQLQRDDQKLTAPPQGYHSVCGKAGVNLNYDELVLYNPDAALPKYVIVYQRDGEGSLIPARFMKSSS